jgi:putative molybdopterin biosynthesis protein
LTLADGYVTVEPSTNYLDEGETVEVALFGGASPPALFGAGERDRLIDTLLEGRDARWLSVGSVEGARRLRNGIVDVAAVGLSQEELDTLGVENASLVRGYDRHVGYVGDTEGEVFGVLSGGYALRRNFDGEGTDAETRVFRSEEGAANAVVSGKVDAAFVGEDIAEKYDLSFEPTGWAPVDFFVADDRREKEGVVSFLSAVEDTSLPDGYRKPDEIGETVTRWD